MFIIIIMPKRTSKRKPRKVTKRKTKRKKRRRRRFGMKTIMKMIRGDNPIADTNPLIMRYAGGEQTEKDIKDSAKFMAMIGPRGSTSKHKQITRLVRKTGKLMANSTSSAQEKKEIYHKFLFNNTWLFFDEIYY